MLNNVKLNSFLCYRVAKIMYMHAKDVAKKIRTQYRERELHRSLLPKINTKILILLLILDIL